MTPREYMRLRAGDIIISRNSKRTMRLVISDAGTCIGLAKVGHSWTDPNPGAWYSAWETQNQFETTDQRAAGQFVVDHFARTVLPVWTRRHTALPCPCSVLHRRSSSRVPAAPTPR